MRQSSVAGRKAWDEVKCMHQGKRAGGRGPQSAEM